ncbi:DUF885 family protein, partial [Piscinibacter sp.]|uniref:DUF885 domain-containing protein n=1 Tax=Piscinibacter sp. TaxID=1903157 RepID=UPI0035B3CD6E
MNLRIAALLLACAPLHALAAAPSDADKRFQAIYEKEWTWRQEQTGQADEDTDTSGDNTRLPDVGAPAQQARLKVWEQVLRDLGTIDPAQLSAENRINLAIYRPQVENLAAEVRLRAYEMPFNSDSSFWSNLSFMARRQMKTADDYRAYAARLRDVPRHFDQHIANMRAGLARGFSVPRAVLDGRDVSIAAVAELKDPEQSAFYAPYRKMPASIPAAEQEALRKEARAAISEHVVPAFGTLLTFFRTEYVPNARTTLAAEAMPGGKDFYAQQIREYTTLDLSAEQIHRIGLEEVARIRAEMQEVIKQTGFKGTFAEFLTFLRTDPQFYA